MGQRSFCVIRIRPLLIFNSYFSQHTNQLQTSNHVRQISAFITPVIPLTSTLVAFFLPLFVFPTHGMLGCSSAAFGGHVLFCRQEFIWMARTHLNIGSLFCARKFCNFPLKEMQENLDKAAALGSTKLSKVGQREFPICSLSHL